MALLSATSPAKAHFSALLLCHDEPQHGHALPPAPHPQCSGAGNRLRARGRWSVSAAVAPAPAGGKEEEKRKPRVLVAGGGIGGLVFALAAQRKGYEVTVFERDLSAVRGEGQYRGPIQIQSNALAALEAIDMSVAEEVMRAGCVTGDRINGLVDGISGSWYAANFTLLSSVKLHLLVRSCCVRCARSLPLFFKLKKRGYS
ncbi:hypothetical protein SEVIR_7G124450v4 [Setaria viridis]